MSDRRRTKPYRYDRADFVALAELSRPRIVAWLFRLAWALFALAAILIALCVAAGSNDVFPYIPILAVLLIAFLLLNRFGAYLGAWTMGRLARRSGTLREQVLTVADDCFRAESSRGKTEIRWTAVPKIRRTEARLFVYLTPYQAFIVPVRAFGSAAEFEAFADDAVQIWKQHHRL